MNQQTIVTAGKLGAALGLALTCAPAAANLLQAVSNVNPITDTVAPFPATTVMTTGFTTTVANQLVRVIYNAECSIGAAANTWLDDTITIDGIAATPSNSDNALCASNGTVSENDGWVSAVTQVFARVPVVGAHTIRVIVQPMPGAAWRIDDQSLVIDTQ